MMTFVDHGCLIKVDDGKAAIHEWSADACHVRARGLLCSFPGRRDSLLHNLVTTWPHIKLLNHTLYTLTRLTNKSSGI